MRISAPVAYILLYAALYAAFGVASPFWPRFFETRALSPQEIGIVLAAAMLTRLLAGPMVGMLADRAGSLRFALAICSALAAASAAALLWAHTFALLLFVTVIQAASLAPTTSLADALSVNAARPRLAGKEFEYGWIRGSASLAFIFGTLTVGQLISQNDVTPIIWLNLSFLIVTAASTALLPPVLARSSPLTGGSSVIGELGELLRDPPLSDDDPGFLLDLWQPCDARRVRCHLVECFRDRAFDHKRPLVGSRRRGSGRVLSDRPSTTQPARCTRRGRPGRRGRHCAVVRCRYDDVRFGAFNYPAAARLYFCPASSGLDAHDADACTGPPGRNEPIHLCVWLGLRDCRADPVIGDSLWQVGRSGILSDGPSLWRRTSACVAGFR